MARIFKGVSIVIHATVIAVVSYLQMFDPGLIPTPRSALAFSEVPIVIRDIPLPRAPRPAPTAPPAVNAYAAPIVVPDGVRPETDVPATPQPGPEEVIGGIDDPGAVASLGVGIVSGPPPPPPPAAPVAPVRLHSGVQAPRKIAHVDPIYPPHAQTARKEGVVILEVVIDAKGAVESVRVLRGVPLLDQAAVSAVQQWRFSPALLNGQPVPVVMTVTVNFALK